MAFGMYGAEASPGRLLQQDQQQAEMRRAQTRQLDAAATKAEMEIEGEKRFLSAMETAAAESEGKPSVSMASKLETAAEAALRAGLPGEAAKLSTNASLVRQRESAAAENAAQEQAAVLKAKAGQLEALSKLVGGVKDQATWDEANAVYAKTYGQVSPYAGKPYDQALVDRLQSATMTAAQRATAAARDADNLSKDRNRRSAAEFREFRKGLAEKELELKRDRENRVKKTTGTEGDKGPAVGSPTSAEQGEATRMLKAEYPNWPADELKSAAYAMASRARGLRRANKALEPQEALAQAFEEAKANGVYEINEGLFKDSTKLRRDKLTSTPLVPEAKPASKLPSGWTVKVK